MEDFVVCKYCNKKYSKHGIGTHIWRVHGEGKTFRPGVGHIPWNKGHTRETDSRVDKISKSLERNMIPIEVDINDDGKLIQKWRNKCVNAKKEGLVCNLTYEQFCQLLIDANLKSSQLGFSGDGYVLARYNDSGNYEIGNCRFVTQKENIDEKNKRSYPDK